MKQIQAYIKTHRLYEVTRALQKVDGLRGMSVTEVKGFGRRQSGEASQPVDELMDFAPYTKIEIFCEDELMTEIVTTIEEKAYTGLRGDGKIYVSPVECRFKIGRGDTCG